MTVSVKGQISYPSFIGVVYEGDTEHEVAIGIIKHVTALQRFAMTKGEQNTSSYELSFNALRHLLSEVIDISGMESTAEDMMETLIVGQALRDIEAAGYTMYDAVEKDSRNAKQMLTHMYDLSESLTLYVEKGEAKSAVQFVRGNGADVISDYGTSLDGVLKKACDLSDSLINWGA